MVDGLGFLFTSELSRTSINSEARGILAFVDSSQVQSWIEAHGIEEENIETLGLI